MFSACNACDPDDQPNGKCKGRCNAMNTVCGQEDAGGCTVLQELFSGAACTCATTATTTTTSTTTTTTTTTTPLPSCCQCDDGSYNAIASCSNVAYSGGVCGGVFDNCDKGVETDASNCEWTTTSSTTTTPLPPVGCCDCGSCGYKAIPAQQDCSIGENGVCDYCVDGVETDAINCELTTTSSTIGDYS